MNNMFSAHLPKSIFFGVTYDPIKNNVDTNKQLLAANLIEYLLAGFTGVKGEVKAEEAVINGNIKGDVIVSGKVTLGSNSHLMGNLTAGILVIQEGARFDGLCNMVKDTRSKTKPLLKHNQSEI